MASETNEKSSVEISTSTTLPLDPTPMVVRPVPPTAPATDPSPQDAPGPYESASFLSKLVYAWVNPLLDLTRRRVLCQGDLGRVPPSYRCDPLVTRFLNLWQTHNGRWLPVLIGFNRRRLAISFLLIALADFVSWGVQLLMRRLIEYLETRPLWEVPGQVPWILYQLAALFLVMTVGRSLLENAGHAVLTGLMTKLKTAIMGALYTKAQRFSHGSREKYSGGSALNIVSVDPNRVYNFVSMINRAWLVPFRLIMTIIIGSISLGWAVAPGISLVLLVIPILLLIANRIKRLRYELATVSDRRMQATQESLQAIKVIKYLAWEDVAARKIDTSRERELSLLKRSNSLYALSMALTFWTPIFAATLSIATQALLQGVLQASEVFSAILAFQTLVAPLRDLPSHLSTYVSAKTAMNRISDFLMAPEATDTFSHDVPPNMAVLISDADMIWDAPPPDMKVKHGSKKAAKKAAAKVKRRRTLELPPDSSTLSPMEVFRLSGINLEIPRGSLVAIIGPIGSGKTSLLESLMGSLQIERGRVALPICSTGYCEQHAWICNASVRDNITFGRPFDEARYRTVIEECCLERDLDMFPFGDETIIGEKGATISGGQRQRIGLARVFYARPDLVLLDDPFSAVDANVGRNLFFSIKDGLLSGCTRLIATHNRSILDEVDLIIVMDKGKIKAQGSYEELLQTTDPRLAAIREILLHSPLYEDDSGEEEADSDSDDDEDSSSDDGDDDDDNVVLASADETAKVSELLVNSETLPSDEKASAAPTPTGTPAPGRVKGRPRQPRKIQKKLEERISKKASSQSYAAYIEGFGGMKAVILISALVVLTEMARVFKDLYMKNQIRPDPIPGNDAIPDPLKSPTSDAIMLFIGVYSGLGLLQGVLSVTANALSVVCCTMASRFIHSKCIQRVLTARLSVFDVTPIGRILNRFARDLETIDNNFPDKLTFLVTCFSTILAAFIIITWAAPQLSFSFIVPVLLAYAVQREFGRVWRQLQQLQGQTLGPVVAHFAETLAGLPTIRALGANSLFRGRFETYLDEFGSSSVWLIGVRRWLGLRSEIIANTYVSCLVSICIGLRTPHQIVGLLIAYMVNAADCIDWTMKTTSEVDTCFVSVERLYKYVMDLETEAESSSPKLAVVESAVEMSPEWPSTGRVVFENVTIQYRSDLPPALSHLSFVLEPGEKVAVVGRTGAGKSTIITAIYRFVELSEGRITLDGRDISQVPVRRLRQALAMVPQDPILFSGTLRDNLDPQGRLADADIWVALEKTCMRDLVASHPDRLLMDVGEGGGLLSVGQKQLLCLARALLRRAHLVIMDEATSAIDRDTDALIQATLRASFAGATVITIAHRLETIMEYDRVLVMGEGRILEAGRPKELACTDGSYFAEMVYIAGIDVDQL